MSYVDEHGDWENKKISLFGVVTSFVKNLKTGQDLTRLPLPAVFLRPYSILEVLGSRHLAYIDLLYNLPDDPSQRMLKILLWYISNLRQEIEQFYKKPYNPVLGEVHKCSANSEKFGEATFVAEQVSHHPPVSAMNIRNVTEGIDVTGNYSFNVRFATNSVTITTEGAFALYLKKFDETYESTACLPQMTMTNVIWGKRCIWWTSDVVITCPKTNLIGKLSFKTVSIKSNQVNVFTGSVLNGEQVVCTFEGECGATASGSWTGDKKQTTLIDLHTLPKTKLHYLPKDQQDPLASTRIWEDTNKAIIDDDMDKADAAKKLVEDRERAKRQEKKDRNEEHEPQYFFYSEDKKIWKRKPE